MARLRVALTEDEVKKTGVADIRKKYNELARDYNRITEGDLYYCHRCNEFHNQDAFYSDKRFSSGLYPDCKKQILMDATDYDKKTNTYTDNKEKTKEVFRKLDIPFIDSLYRSALSSITEEVGEKNRQTAFQQLLVMVKSLPQYKGKTYENSEFDDEENEALQEEINENSRILKTARRRFGKEYIPSDLIWLENNYQDWCARTAVDSLSQETYVKQICLQLLDIDKDRKANKDVTNKLKALDTLMNSANLQPRQNVSNSATDALTFGQLIERWEMEKPIPEPDEEFKDVNSVGKFLRVYFSGHLSRALGLKNAYSKEYEDEIAKYTVTKPESTEEGSSTEIYDYLFGSEEGE